MTKINSSDPLSTAGRIRKKIIVIVGPTASGKSDLAVQLALLLRSGQAKKSGYPGSEIISADSKQVYRGMDLGTGKVPKDPSPNSKSKIFKGGYYSGGIRHHLIDVVSPKKQFTADDFKRLGRKAINDIWSRDKIPIIAGGTGFYIDVLLGRMNTAETPPDPKLRAKLEKQSAKQLYSRLLSIDRERAQRIDRCNKRRLVRAIEIAISKNRFPETAQAGTIRSSPGYDHFNMPAGSFDIIWIGVNPGKEELAENIKKRLDRRLGQGMMGEVEALHKRGVSWKRLDGFGLEYRWISRYLKNKGGKEKTKTKNQKLKFKNSGYYEKLLIEIIRYSKRQITWFKGNENINWVTGSDDLKKLIAGFI